MAHGVNIATPLYHVNVEDHVVITTLHQGTSDANAPQTPRVARRHRRGAPERATGRARAVPADESTQTYWKKKSGEYLVKDVLVKELKRRDIRWPKEDIVQGRLASFPEGYTLVSVPRLTDNGTRKDHYLISPHYDDDEFRSPAEFAPHLAWLMTGQPRDANRRPTCNCCLCVKLKTGHRPNVDHTKYQDIHNYFSAPHHEAASSRGRQIRVSTSGPSRSTAQTTQDIISRARDYRRFDSAANGGDD